MPASNTTIAGLFDRLADLLEIEGANPFRVRAYRNAARTIGGYGRQMADLLAEKRDLSELPDIGKDIAAKVETIVATGNLPLLVEVEARTPGTLSDMMKLEGLGPKRVKLLYDELGIVSFEELAQAAREGRIHELEGFGKKTEQKILESLEHFAGAEHRVKLGVAEEIAAGLLAHLERSEGIRDLIVAGSYRRRKETVGDLDILATARDSAAVMNRLTSYEDVADVVSKGRTRSTVKLKSGMQVDLRVVPQVSFGAALHYFTGSKAHNIAVRELAMKRGLKINEYGVFRDDRPTRRR